ncbi:MAG: DMT family transporter [Alphaproteobacteria bacterium]|nr:DMT family transporter [Alphaproteobacteria bacterium]
MTTPAAEDARLNRTVLLAFALAVLAMAMWSGNWVVVRAARTDIPPLGLNFWRWVVATLVLAPFAGAAAWRDWPAARRHWRVMLGLGATGAASFHSMINIGLRATEVINALLLNLVLPVIIIVMAWAVFRDTISRRQMLGIAISLVGGVVLVSRGEIAALARLQFNTGDLWVLCALVVWGVYSVLLKRRPVEIGGLSLLFYMSVVGVALMAPAYAWETLAAGRPVSLNPSTAASIAYTGVVASVLAFLCYNAALAWIGPNATSFFLLLMPVFGSALAIIFLGETLHLYHLVAFATVFVGILLATYKIAAR